MYRNRYHEQLDRVDRWLDRIKHPGEDRTENEDFLWAFFQNCWHLKDWIADDPASGQSGDDMDKAIEGYDSLRVVQGLALSGKHLKVDSSKRPAKDPRVDKALVLGRIHLGREESDWISYVAYDASANEWIPALELAEQAVKDWIEILTEKGLL